VRAGAAAGAGAEAADVAFGSDGALVADCAHANGPHAMLIPVSMASRFTFHFNDNHLSRTARATDTNWKFLMPVWLPVFETEADSHYSTHIFAPRTLHLFAPNLYSLLDSFIDEASSNRSHCPDRLDRRGHRFLFLS
jgi:hypothetical protein